MEMTFFGAVPVDKHRISTKIWSIAVEAFGRHLKRVDASALFFWRFLQPAWHGCARPCGGIRAGNVASRIDLAIQLPLDAVISQDADSVSAHLNSSIIRLVITTVLFTMSLSRTVNMQ